MTTAYPETNAEVIEKALYCLKHGETESVENWLDLLRERLTTDNSRAAVRVCAIADIECSRDCGTGDCKREREARYRVEQHEAAPTEVTADWRGDFERKARVGGFNLSREETGGDYCHDGSAAAWLWYYSGRLDQACSAAQPAPSAPLEGTGNGADERAAQVADYLNAPGMWAQVYCCAVFVRGWPSDMARSAADEAVKEFGDAACKTVADLTNTLDEVLRVD